MTSQEHKSKQEKMYLLIEQWEQSGLPKQLFCERHKIAYHVFYYYHTKYQGKQKKRSNLAPKGFLPVKITPSLPSVLEVSYPNGVLVKFSASMETDLLKELIKIF